MGTNEVVTRPSSVRGSYVWRRYLLPGLAAILPLVAAVLGALAIGRGGGIVGGVETLSSTANNLLGSVGTLLPLGFAFGAGMVSTVNPCGFAMLPAYLGLYLGSNEDGGVQIGIARRLGRGALVGATVSAGFIVLFGAAGLAIGGGARALVGLFAWIGLAVGVLLVLAGAWMVRGGKLYTGIAAQAASHIGNPGQVGVRGYFLFGLSYGIASLSCTLPIFLAVVGTSLATGGFAAAVGQFLAYALGMGFVIMVLTLLAAMFKASVAKALRRVLPYVNSISAALMILAGAYIVFYWLTTGGLLSRLGIT
jgi:cytochrome c biogenesis protein CcdA